VELHNRNEKGTSKKRKDGEEAKECRELLQRISNVFIAKEKDSV